jgi:hypothetical protein
MLTQICSILFLLAATIIGGGSANGERWKMPKCYVLNNILFLKKEIDEMVLSPPSTSLSLNSFSLASLRMFWHGPRAMR